MKVGNVSSMKTRGIKVCNKENEMSIGLARTKPDDSRKIPKQDYWRPQHQQPGRRPKAIIQLNDGTPAAHMAYRSHAPQPLTLAFQTPAAAEFFIILGVAAYILIALLVQPTTSMSAFFWIKKDPSFISNLLTDLLYNDCVIAKSLVSASA